MDDSVSSSFTFFLAIAMSYVVGIILWFFFYAGFPHLSLQGGDHFFSMFTPLTFGRLLKYRRDTSLAPLWAFAFNLHRALDLLLHCYFLYTFPWRLDHAISLVSHGARYAGKPWQAYDGIVVCGKLKLELYVDCLGQFVSMLACLGWLGGAVALLLHLVWRRLLVGGLDLAEVRAAWTCHRLATMGEKQIGNIWHCMIWIFDFIIFAPNLEKIFTILYYFSYHMLKQKTRSLPVLCLCIFCHKYFNIFHQCSQQCISTLSLRP